MIHKVLSIEIGEHKTKLCVTDYRKRHPKVYSAYILDTPANCCSDGYIQNRTPLVNAISGKLKERNINISDVIFTISSSRIASHDAIIPPVKPKEIKEVIRAEASNYFPIDLTDYILSYIILEKPAVRQKDNYRLLVIAAQNNLLLSYYELAKDCKLNIVSIDYLNNSILQIIKKQSSSKETDMYIQINEQNTLVNIINNGVLKLHRMMAYGYGAAVKAVTDCPAYKIGNEAAALDFLTRASVINTNFSPAGDSQSDAAADTEGSKPSGSVMDHKNEVTEALRYLLLNINRVIEYYSSKNEGKLVQTIYLTGIGAKLNGFPVLLSNETGIPVQVLDKVTGVNFSQAALPADYLPGDFSDCAGAVLAPLDLIPKQYAQKLEKINKRQAAAVICMLSLITSAALIFISSKKLSDYRSERNKLKDEIAELEPVESNFRLNQVLSEKKNSLDAIEESCNSSSGKIGELIKELECKLPDGAVLSALTSNETGIIMDITVSSEDALAMFFLQMNTIDFLTNVKTEHITKETSKYGETLLKYIITASYAVIQ